ncbi:MAG: amidohydrolase [Lachnospiraceae bacterium]
MKTIYINGNVISMNHLNERFQAFAVDADCITKVGNNAEVIAYTEEFAQEYETIDLQNKTVLPGFNDSHLHLLNFAYSRTKIDCNGLTSIDEIIKVGKNYIKEGQIPAGTWVSGRGWNQVFLKENRALTRDDLDKISTEHPIVFTRVCEHMVVVNSKALELAGITKNTKNPEGGEIEKDGAGYLTGMLKETARYLVYQIIPQKSIEEIKEMLVGAIEVASSYGVTSAQTDDFETFSDKDWRKVITAYEELIAEERLNIRIYEQCLLPEIGRLNDFLAAGNYTGKGNEYFKIGPLKLLTDGSLGGRTAYLSVPYHDAPDRQGIPVFTQEELDNLIVTAHTHKMQLVCHGIGDGAMNMILDSFAKAQTALPKNDARMGIIHVQITDEAIIHRFKAQNILAYLEPVCLNSDLHIAEDRVGAKLAKTSYNYRRFCDLGIVTPMSSDCPVDSLNPFDSMYVGINRTDYQGFPEGGWMPEQKLTIEQMLKGFTIQGAFASFEESIKGSIEVGKKADFIVVSADPTTVNPHNLRNIYVEETYLGGMCVFKK